MQSTPPPENQPSTEAPKAIGKGDLVARDYARACGILAEDDIDDFLNPLPELCPQFESQEEFTKAAARIEAALGGKEPILIFGDADVDGMTASVQMRDYLLATGHPKEKLKVFIPNRHHLGYGLTRASIDIILAEYSPALVIALDCGSAAPAEFGYLADRGIDVIIVDHHTPEEQKRATAHLNPPAPPRLKRLELLCAASLVYFLCDELNERGPSENWNRDRALILAGLGTVSRRQARRS